ncbi:MAG: 30S ribosomal protein S20 [Anaerolineae bacterium]|nr:MAG: 30S ribosomal protein S20 [Anaerolineae bacterium]
MANTASAKKRIRSSAKRRVRNRPYHAAARTYVKRTRLLLEQGEIEAAAEMAQMAVKTLDKAAGKKIIHSRNAARRKSRLMKQLAAAQKAAAE